MSQQQQRYKLYYLEPRNDHSSLAFKQATLEKLEPTEVIQENGFNYENKQFIMTLLRCFYTELDFDDKTIVKSIYRLQVLKDEKLIFETRYVYNPKTKPDMDKGFYIEGHFTKTSGKVTDRMAFFNAVHKKEECIQILQQYTMRIIKLLVDSKKFI